MSAGIRIEATRSPVKAFARLVIGAVIGVAALAPLACSSGEECDGVEIAGRCEKKCSPAACPVSGSTCFNNACAAPCPNGDTATECSLGTRCEALDDGSGNIANYCVIYDFALGGSGKIGQANEACTSDTNCDTKRGWICDASGTCMKPCETHADCTIDQGEVCSDGHCIQGGDKKYEPCSASTECAQGAGFMCVDGECRVVGCRSHQDCAVIGYCSPGTTDTNESVLACVKGPTSPAGQYGTICPGGPKGDECDADNGYVCWSAGERDFDGYCTKTGCQTDADCGIGEFCTTTRTSRPPCEAACGFDGDPNNANCVAADQIGAGKPYTCGTLTLLRNVCVKREFCNECEKDEDCLALPDQICATDSGGRKICTVTCDPNIGSCPWGSATSCGDWDNDGVFTCSHRFTAGCVGTGKSCEPCIDDADCPNGLCWETYNSGERFCVDLGPSCTCFPCATDADCPNGQCEGRCRFGGAVCVSDSQCAAKTCDLAKGKCTGTYTGCTTDQDCLNTCNKGSYYCKGMPVDQDFTCKTTATLDTGCPKTPGGLQMDCWGGNDVKAADSPLYNKCVGANINLLPGATRLTGCWPQ